MSVKRRYPHGVAFTMLVGMYPHGTDPSRPGGVPLKLRDTVSMGQFHRDGERNLNARMTTVLAGASQAIGSITVADNNFATGAAELLLGDQRLLAGLDFAIGALAANTAANLITAINNLPEFTAASGGGAVVNVTYLGGQIDVVQFEARHYGTQVNFTLNPATRQMTFGEPHIGPPLLT